MIIYFDNMLKLDNTPKKLNFVKYFSSTFSYLKPDVKFSLVFMISDKQ